jgi:hypothetical protein
MAKALKVVAIVAGAAAIVATGGMLLAGAGTFLGMTAGTFATISAVATVVAGVANIGQTLMAGGARPPPARGSVSRIIVDPNAPRPSVLGRCYTGGVLRHDTGYGTTLNDVPNPYRGMVIVYDGAGPVKSVTPKVDYASIPNYYSGFLYTDTQTGACPESDALAPHFTGMPDWGSDYKLSGSAAALWNFKFDADGKVFSSGLPLLGAVVEGGFVYDPRKDSTYPGGSGAHRLNSPSTWEYSTNPALHAGSYAYGRYQNGKLVFGIGMPASAVIWSDVAAWANVCEANGWTIGGTIYEGGDDATRQRWSNLTEICLAGGAEPVFANGMLGFFFSAPKVALDTITDDDIVRDDASVTVMQPWRDRINTAVPQYRSEEHNWEIVSAEAVNVSTYVTEDGEEKVEAWPFNLVTDADQAAELATYRIVNARELSPITLRTKPRLRGYRPGDCLQVQSDLLDLDMPCVIVHRELDPATMEVTLTLISETDEKHDYALGLTAVPPPTPVLQMSGEDRDDIAAWRGSERTNLIYRRATTRPSTPSPSAGVPSGWYDDATSPSGSNALWESFGIKKAGATNFVWGLPVSAVIDPRIYDGLDSGGNVNAGKVDTLSLQAGTVSVTSTSSGSDTLIGAGATVTVLETGWITVGDVIDGGALALGFCSFDSGTTQDCGGAIYLDIDTGSGYTQVATTSTGVRTNNADTYSKAPMLASASVAGVASIKLRMRVQSIAMPSSTAKSFYVRSPQFVVFAGQR